MKKQTIFKGVATALITPLNENGIDYENFGRVIDWQIEQGVNGLVICGTTGEGSTLSDEEHRDALEFAMKRANGRTAMIAGTGSNDIAYAIDLTKFACELNYDGMLLVTPYYNKATQRGLIESFTAIADESTKPCILYNVPSRTGVNIEPATYGVLADHPMITSIKEANGNISKIMETMQIVGDRLDMYSGNDDQVIPILSAGGAGVISVLSNVMPKETVAMCDKFFAGDLKGALKFQLDMLPLINALFCEVNPIPVKAAMAAMGYCEDYLRLPLTSMEDANKEKMLRLMREQGLDV